LVKSDTQDLATSLRLLFADEEGKGGLFFSNVIFGVGVIAMTLSSISLMMLISGFVFCEIFNVATKGWIFRLGCMAAASGAFWPLFWAGEARAWLTIVAGVFGAMLLPIAYFTFYLLMNQKSLLKEQMPTGARRLSWNVLMAFAAFSATVSSVYSVWKRSLQMFGSGWYGIGVLVAFVALALAVQFRRSQPPQSAPTT
jgi:hypothetical protein